MAADRRSAEHTLPGSTNTAPARLCSVPWDPLPAPLKLRHTAVIFLRTDRSLDVEPPRQVGEACTPSHQHETTIPHRLQFAAVHYRRLPFEWIVDEGAVVGCLCQEEETPVSAT